MTDAFVLAELAFTLVVLTLNRVPALHDLGSELLVLQPVDGKLREHRVLVVVRVEHEGSPEGIVRARFVNSPGRAHAGFLH